MPTTTTTTRPSRSRRNFRQPTTENGPHLPGRFPCQYYVDRITYYVQRIPRSLIAPAADQAPEHSADYVNLAERTANRRFSAEPEFTGDVQLRLELRRASSCVLKKLLEGASVPARTRCGVRRDGNRGSSHLCGEPKALSRRETLGHAIHVEYKPMGYLPHTELSVVMHALPIPLRRPGWNGFVIRDT